MPITVTITNGEKRDVLTATRGENLLELLAHNGYAINAACGGNGTCGKCKVKLICGEYSADANGYIIACKTNIVSNIAIEINENRGSGLTYNNVNHLKSGGKGFGVALDIGTTTLAFYLVDLATGEQLQECSALNPQCAFGADVISRIKACREGKLEILNTLIINAINETIENFKKRYKINQIEKLTISGNTTMLHLLCNVDPSPMGVAPFTPAFTSAIIKDGKMLNLEALTVEIMPSISAYVGADIMSGIISCNLANEDGAVLIDIGTNGEMAINSGGNILCCSTSAGPAFEGANISQGSGGIVGAINKVDAVYNNLVVNTISGEAKTICGCGLIDAVAIMVQYGIIDETGAFNNSYDGNFSERLIGDKFFLTKDIAITQKDIREVQLAKSAICAGLKTLISIGKKTFDTISTIYIAGGLGFYINKESACAIGLLPKELKNKIVIVGNSSGSGAKYALTDENILPYATKLLSNCSTIELSNNKKFLDEYIDNMFF